jgi:cyclically-permuted mutarotase family protein
MKQSNTKHKKSSSKFLCLGLFVLTSLTVKTATLTWQANLPNLPAPAGEAIQHGVAGAYSGVIKLTNEAGIQSEVLVVAGGANFAKKPLLEAFKSDVAPEKIYHQAIFLLRKDSQNKSHWQQAKIALPLGAAYGKSFTTEQGILLFGGEIKQLDGSVKKSADIGLISYQESKLSYKKIGDMPVTFAKGGAVSYQGKIYIVGGIQNGKSTNNVYSYDIKAARWAKELPFPGLSRIAPIVTVHEDKDKHTATLYVLSGFSTDNKQNIALDDGVTLSLSAKVAQWQKIPSIKALKDKQMSLIGAAAIKVDAQQTLFLGGYNKKTWDNWLKTYQSVQGSDQDKAAKIEFFSQQPLNFNWNKEALLFDSSAHTWTSLGETPFLPNCGAAIAYWQDSIVLINGEIMPGVRTAEVKIATFNNKPNNKNNNNK